jgi:hypothetical protein
MGLELASGRKGTALVLVATIKTAAFRNLGGSLARVGARTFAASLEVALKPTTRFGDSMSFAKNSSRMRRVTANSARQSKQRAGDHC